jgi:hypothetical protein
LITPDFYVIGDRCLLQSFVTVLTGSGLVWKFAVAPHGALVVVRDFTNACYRLGYRRPATSVFWLCQGRTAACSVSGTRDMGQFVSRIGSIACHGREARRVGVIDQFAWFVPC